MNPYDLGLNWCGDEKKWVEAIKGKRYLVCPTCGQKVRLRSIKNTSEPKDSRPKEPIIV